MIEIVGFILCLGFAVLLVYAAFVKLEREGPQELGFTAVREGDLITFTYSNGEIKQYKGRCTVWYEYPLMQRASTSTEAFLCDVEAYIDEHGNPYPLSHLKNEL